MKAYRAVTGTTLDECERQLRDGERIVNTQGSRVTGQVVCMVEVELPHAVVEVEHCPTCQRQSIVVA